MVFFSVEMLLKISESEEWISCHDSSKSATEGPPSGWQAVEDDLGEDSILHFFVKICEFRE